MERLLDSFQPTNRAFNEMRIRIQQPIHNGEGFSGELEEIQDVRK